MKVSRVEPLRIIEGRQVYRVGAATLPLKVCSGVWGVGKRPESEDCSSWDGI